MPKHYTKFTTQFLSQRVIDNKTARGLRKQCRWFYKYGLAPQSLGNASVRTKGGFFITASGASLGKLRKNEIARAASWRKTGGQIVVQAHGRHEPSSESLLHSEIYKARKDVKTIFHGHDYLILKHAKELQIPATNKKYPYGTLALAKEAAKIAKRHDFFVLKDHGVVILEKNMENAARKARLMHLLAAECEKKTNKNLRLILVRHGESVHNVRGLIQGNLPSRLTKDGLRQARKVGRRLKEEGVDIVFTSDLRRAHETAREIAKASKAPLVKEERLREMRLGKLEGKHKGKIYWQPIWDFWFHKKGDMRELGLEEMRSAVKRAKDFLREVRKKYHGKAVVVVSHGGFINVLFSVIKDKKPGRDHWVSGLGNTCVNVFEISENGKFKEHLVNCVRHL